MSDEFLSQRLGALHDDVSEMKVVLKELTTAINKLALVEQQQGQLVLAQERAFQALAKLDERLLVVERRMPEVIRTSGWVERVVVFGAGALGVFALKKIGLL